MGLRNLFKRENKKKVSGEDFLNSELIYNTASNFLILISFSASRFNDAMEFMSDCKKVVTINALYRHSSYEEETDQKDDKGYTIYNVYDRYYILIGGDDEDFYQLFYYSDNLANSLLDSIKSIISENRKPDEYEGLMKDEIFDKFKYSKKSVIEYPDNGIPCYSSDGYTWDAWYDDVISIRKKLPECFTLQSIADFIICGIDECNYTLADVIRDYEGIDSFKYFEDLIRSVLNNQFSVSEALEILNGPQYMIPDDDIATGYVSNAELDEIFRQKYDQFTGVVSDDIEYEDIDEQLSSEVINDDEEQ